MNKVNLKKIYTKYKRFFCPLLYGINRLFGVRIRNRGKNNRVQGLSHSILRKTHIHISGNDNEVIFGNMTSAHGVSISIHGNHNRLIFGDRNYLVGCGFFVEDDCNRVELAEHVYVYSKTEISAIEGTEVYIGKDSLLSANIMIRTGDSHVIFDNTTGERVNDSANISIHDHVWLGNGCKVLKGSQIPADCVIAAGAIVTHNCPDETNVVLGGIPAKILRRGIGWNNIR